MRRVVLVVGGAVGLVAVAVDRGGAASAASRTWPPFVLVVGLLLIGQIAHRDGMFDRVAAFAGRVGGRGVVLFVVLLALVAMVTAVLNLDTSVAFLTPVLVLAARRRGLAEEPFLFGSLFMANSASLLLPGSNLTNLLVLAGHDVSGVAFAARMLPAWIAAVAVTTVVLIVVYRRTLSRDGEPDHTPPAASGWIGVAATASAAIVVLGSRSPAVAVVSLGAVAVAIAVATGRLRIAEAVSAVDVAVLVGLFGLAMGLGTLAGSWSGPGHLMASVNRWESAAIGAMAAVFLNNLPAAVLLSAHAPAHPRALLIGLDLGPNLAVTGSLSALLWFQAAKTVGARPSLLRVSAIGAVLAPCSATVALGALAVFSPR